MFLKKKVLEPFFFCFGTIFFVFEQFSEFFLLELLLRIPSLKISRTKMLETDGMAEWSKVQLTESYVKKFICAAVVQSLI